MKWKNYTIEYLRNNILVSVLATLIFFVFLAGIIFHKYELVRNILQSFFFFFFLLIPGYALLSTRYFKKITSLEKFCFAFGISSFFYAVFAIISFALFYQINHSFNLAILLILNSGGVFYIFNKKKEPISTGERNTIISVAVIVLSFIVFLQVFISLPFKMPNPLPDGPYVFKNPENLHVKIQALTGGLPADNFVPFAFSEFLLQKISFEKNRPMLPGQEVSNRTVLMGLDGAFFLSIFKPAAQAKSDVLDKFIYLTTPWPDVGKFGNDNKAFATFLDLGIALNGIFLFAIFLLISKLFGNNKAMGIVLLFLLFPYVASEVIFTWPKFLMAYFLILALYLVISKRYNYSLLPFSFAMAYHSHPAAMIYIGFFLAYWLVKNFEADAWKKSFLNFSKIILFYAVLVAPWTIWTKYIVKIPAELISQNLISKSYDWKFIANVRLVNWFYLFVPWLHNIPDLKTKITYEMTNYFPGAVGLYIFVCYYYILRYFKKYFWEITMLALGPMIILVLPWGKVMEVFAVLFAHPSVILFFAFGAAMFSKNKKWTVVFISVQSILSVYVLWFGVYNLPLQAGYFHVSKIFLAILFSFQLIWFFTGLRLLIRKPETVVTIL